MRKLVNYLRGTVRVCITGKFPERVINLCAQNRVEFWNVEWQDENTVQITLRLCGFEMLEQYARRVECEVELRWRRGFPEFVGKFRRRYGFLIGLVLALCAVGILSRFVFTIEISGNERVTDGEIMQQLRRFGVRPGAYGPGLDRRQIEQEILLELKELAWMTVNLSGTRVQVVVREKASAPERVEESGFCHIVSEADGIITRVEPELGDALVDAGDTVGRGDVLISGTVTLEPPKYSDLPERYYHLHARGRVWARTWRQITAAIPVQTEVKVYTGRDKTAWSIKILDRRVEFFGNSSILDGFYDRITSVRQLVLPGGREMPVWLVRDTVREYGQEIVPVDLNAAVDLLEGQLAQRLETLVGKDGRVLNVKYETRVADGLIRVTAIGECEEEIGREVSAQQG